MPDEFGGIDLSTDDFGGIAIDVEPTEQAPAKPSLLKEFASGLFPVAESKAFLAKQQEKLAPIGKALDWAGQQAGRNLKAQAFLAIGQPELAMQQMQIPEEIVRAGGYQPEPDYTADPMAQGMKALPTPLRVASEATYGIGETIPRLGAMAALSAAGLPAPYAGGAAFGLTPEGLNPKEALIGAVLPGIGHGTGRVVEAMASKLGVTRDAALGIWNKLGGAAGAAALLGGINEAEIRQLPPEQREEARIQMAGSLLAQSVLGMTGGRTPRPRIEYPTGADLPSRVGAVPTPENVQFLERVEQPKRIISPEEKQQQTWEQEVVDAQKKILYGTTDEAAQALERLKVLRGATEPVPREGKLAEGETFPRSGVFDTAEERIVQQKGFAEPAKAVEVVPEKAEVQSLRKPRRYLRRWQKFQLRQSQHHPHLPTSRRASSCADSIRDCCAEGGKGANNSDASKQATLDGIQMKMNATNLRSWKSKTLFGTEGEIGSTTIADSG